MRAAFILAYNIALSQDLLEAFSDGNFEEQWQRASSDIVFHGKEFFARSPNGQRVQMYKGWTNEQAQTYLIRGRGHCR